MPGRSLAGRTSCRKNRTNRASRLCAFAHGSTPSGQYTDVRGTAVSMNRGGAPSTDLKVSQLRESLAAVWLVAFLEARTQVSTTQPFTPSWGGDEQKAYPQYGLASGCPDGSSGRSSCHIPLRCTRISSFASATSSRPSSLPEGSLPHPSSTSCSRLYKVFGGSRGSNRHAVVAEMAGAVAAVAVAAAATRC